MKKTQEYLNFYETIKESNMRLQQTIILYKEEPYYVYTVVPHEDGVFRIYMEPTGNGTSDLLYQSYSNIPYHDDDDYERAENMDNWFSKVKHGRMVRKKMNSPYFNRFRPFELGMCNINGTVLYTERQPLRCTYQGLTQQMVQTHPISLADAGGRRLYNNVDMCSSALKDTILNQYPSPDTAISMLKGEKKVDAAAFCRSLAFVRGPVDTFFLAGKDGIIGSLPYGNMACVRLTPDTMYMKEQLEETGLFGEVIVN